MKKTVHKKVQGLWEVQCRQDDGVLLARKLNDDYKSYWFRYCLDPDEMFNCNALWYGKGKVQFTHEEILSVNWPSYLQPGETEKIMVLPSGDFYVEE